MRDQKFAQLANHISDVLLDDWDWLGNKPLEEQVLGLGLIRLWQHHPVLADELTKVYCCKLSDDLVFVIRHQKKQVLQSLNFLEVLFEQGGGLLENISVWLLELG